MSLQVIDTVGPVSVWDPLMDLQGLAAYSTLSGRTLQDLLNDPRDPIPSYRVGTRVIIRKSEFDAWLSRRSNVNVIANAHARLATADAHALLAARRK